MFKIHKFLGFCLILAVLFASTAHAETLFIDPGTPGAGAQNFDYTVADGGSNVVLWTDNKTLEWEAGTHMWLTPGVPGNLVYSGVLLDAAGVPIDNTEFAGRTPGENDPVPLGVINLPQRTVFSGMLITSPGGSAGAIDFDWNWDDNDRPLVGENGNTPPVADAGGPYTGTVGEAVTFDGKDSTGNITQYFWDFGDGATDVGVTVTHVYSAPDLWTVGMSVLDASGATSFDSTTADIVADSPPVMGEVSKVAAEGEPLLDGIVLTQILLDGGVAINRSGKVAFGGRAANDTVPAVFTQDGLVVKEGQALPDGTIVNDLSPFGGVAISVGPSGDRVAFHGQAETGLNDTDAVFTQAEVVAAEGAPLPDGTIVKNIKPEGKVAINDFGEIAFHGKIEVEGDGLDTEEFRAVFTEAGVAAQEGAPLGDGTTIVENIDETGGVAINFLGMVAFHGEVVAPEAGGDTVPAVFTQDGLVAKEGGTLPDGTIVADIDENGGVAINFFGMVAFHGEVVAPEAGGDTVPAVFTQDGLVVKEGQALLDGTIVEEIDQSGGVGIDFSGNVVFHGRTDGVRAVFTQKGLVAKEGEPLPDDTTLDEISVTGGVAISEFGEVAFHGKVGTTDAVFLGKAP